MCKLYANITQFYRGDLSTHRFWYPRGGGRAGDEWGLCSALWRFWTCQLLQGWERVVVGWGGLIWRLHLPSLLHYKHLPCFHRGLIWWVSDTCIRKHSACSAAQSCLTLPPHELCSPSDSSIHGVFQARILEWVAISSSRGSSWPRDQTCISCIPGEFFTTEPSEKPQRKCFTNCEGASLLKRTRRTM